MGAHARPSRVTYWRTNPDKRANFRLVARLVKRAGKLDVERRALGS